MDSQIHSLALEAYHCVLLAFCAQSESLTWDKEGLLTELRKELRISDDEHREILRQVNSDDLIKSLRKARRSSAAVPPCQMWRKSSNIMPSHESAAAIPLPSVPLFGSMQHGHDQSHNDAFEGNIEVARRPAPVSASSRKMKDAGKATSSQIQASRGHPVHPSLIATENDPHVITILDTNTLITEVEKVFMSRNPDPEKMEKGRTLLREQEISLKAAIKKLGNMSDVDSEGTP